MPLPQREDYYTIEDIYALPEGTRAELIDGPDLLHGTTYQKTPRYRWRTVSEDCEITLIPRGSCKIARLSICRISKRE
ncbi:MAG: hypothetical protein ACLVBP_02600 [Ruminococcus sp.]